MNKKEFLGASLHTGLKLISDAKAIFEFNGIVDDVIYFHNKIYCGEKPNYGKTGFGNMKHGSFSIIARPLSDLTKPITHNGKTFVPILKLAEILIDAKIKKETVTTVDEKTGWIGCEFWDVKSQRYLMCIFMPKYGLSIVDNCQDELMFSTIDALRKLIEWHFNLMDESEPFIPVTTEFNPYK